MTLLILFAFIGGVVTILSPCILPVLPIVLGTATQEGKKRPLGVMAGFVLSFTFFTLFLTAIVRATNLSADALRTLAALVIFVFGLAMLIPRLQAYWETIASKLSVRRAASQDAHGFKGGLAVGVSLGLVWTPCVGPILASIITLAATAQVTAGAVVITLAYAAGTAIPMFALVAGSKKTLATVPALKKNSQSIQRAFGVLMLAAALAIYSGFDRTFQAYILEKFPRYGVGLTSLEDTDAVKSELKKLQNKEDNMSQLQDKIANATRPQAPELMPGGVWINSEPLTIQELTANNKVVLVDFWTYSCINCIRTLPYLKAWHEKYVDEGLVIIGVHSPEFEFEKSESNVKEAVKDFGITYPIVQDNDFATWKAYSNHYWPAKYLIDKNGRIRYTHFGEGAYDETEKKIRELLQETGATPESELVQLDEFRHETRTPETYLGYWRIMNFASVEPIQQDKKTIYTAPESLQTNEWAYEGSWMIGYQHAEAGQGAKLHLRFDAKDVHLVMRPKDEGTTPRVTILLDGKKSGYETDDVTGGSITLDKDRLYTLLNLESAENHTITIEFQEGGVEVFAFTFG